MGHNRTLSNEGGCGSILNDLTMIRHQFDGDIIVYPLADVHYGAVEHNADGWTKLLKSLDEQPNAYCVLVGDLVNNSVRNAVGTGVYDDICSPHRQKEYMVEALRPLVKSGKVLCTVSGNHEFRSRRESDAEISFDIAARLGIENLYRQYMAFMAVGIGTRDNGKPVDVFRFCITHGNGGGMTGSAVNRNERFAQILDGVDILITAHTHHGAVTRPSKLVIDCRNDIVVQKDYVVCSCVSWLKYGGYAMQKMLSPSSHSNPQRILLKGSKNKTHQNKQIEILW